MDASALVVIAVSGAVGGAALWIGAGWLQQAAREAARATRRARLTAIAAHPGPKSALPLPRPRASAAAPPAAAPAAPAVPVLQDSIPMTSGPETTTGWPSTNFPATQPGSLADLNTGYADTMPMPLPER